MPIVTEFDVFEAVNNRWTALGATVGTPIPGGLHAEKKPRGKTWPYVVCRVEADRVEEDSSSRVLQTFGVELTAWAEGGAAARAVRPLLDTVMAERSLTVPNAVRLIRVWPRPGKLELTPELRLGNDVLTAAGRWFVKVEADRGT